MSEEQSNPSVQDRYAPQFAQELARNEKEQREIEARLAQLRADHTALTGLLAALGHGTTPGEESAATEAGPAADAVPHQRRTPGPAPRAKQPKPAGQSKAPAARATKGTKSTKAAVGKESGAPAQETGTDASAKDASAKDAPAKKDTAAQNGVAAKAADAKADTEPKATAAPKSSTTPKPSRRAKPTKQAKSAKAAKAAKSAKPVRPAEEAAQPTETKAAKESKRTKPAKSGGSAKTTKSGAARAANGGTLQDVISGLLAGHAPERRTVRELFEELKGTHPERASSTQSVRNALNGLLRKGSIEREENQGAVWFGSVNGVAATTPATPPVQPHTASGEAGAEASAEAKDAGSGAGGDGRSEEQDPAKADA